MTDRDIRRRLCRLVARAGSQRVLAAQIGVSQAYLSDVLRAHRAPGPRILAYLKLRRSYSRIRTTS